jgi:hypothetical protein
MEQPAGVGTAGAPDPLNPSRAWPSRAVFWGQLGIAESLLL